MGESEEHRASSSDRGMQLQGGTSSSSTASSGGGGGGGWRVNKEVTLPILMVLKESLEAEIRQVKTLINIVKGEDVLVEEKEEEDQQEIQRKALEDEQDRSLELEMQIEVMKLTVSCGFGGTSGDSALLLN